MLFCIYVCVVVVQKKQMGCNYTMNDCFNDKCKCHSPLFTFFTSSFQLDICCGVQEKDLVASPPMLEKVSTFSYSDLHIQEDTTTDVKLFLKLRTCLHTCGLYDFSWKDLHTPTAKRLRWQLSAIVNLAKFREDQLLVYSDLNEPVR